jgi:hypothetical protein
MPERIGGGGREENFQKPISGLPTISDFFLESHLVKVSYDICNIFLYLSVPMAVRCKARTVFDHSNTGIVCSNPARGMDLCICVLLCCAVLCR